MGEKRKRNDYLELRLTAYAKRIRELREDNDLTQKQVADMINVCQKTYGDYELGKIRIPVDSLIILARHYDTDMNFICGVSRKKMPFPSDLL